uniref:Arf-GAP domain-containing protein n=1 Tax=Aegilops tauschii subsp. strangulata TaxID=200361 RepID=A0A453NQ33_AEGTS
MASRVKEDEKNERVIRGLLKLPANKRCINCNNLVATEVSSVVSLLGCTAVMLLNLNSGPNGPQYVCTNFWTFVCTNCSGAHREFTHRVKSVSMAKFTAQEVTALQGGGNERAREIFFKEWDSQRNPYPDSSNTDKLRNFIKHIYVERRYTGERSSDRPPRGKDDKDEHSENRRSDGNRGGSRSPPYNESYSDRRSYSGRSDDRNSRHSYGERSPGYDQNDYKKSPRHFEAVDDRSGKTTPVQRFEDRRFSEPRKPETGSPNYQREANGSSPPVVRPVREILGDDAPQLRIDEPPKPNVARPIDPPKPNGTRTIEPPPQAQVVLGVFNPSQTLRTSTASSIGSSEGISEQTKAATPVSLIDFGADPEPTASAPPSQTAPTPQQQPVSAQPINATTPQHVLEQGKSAPSVSGGDWASFDAFGQQQQTPQVGSTVNPLESVLAQLSFSETPSASNTSAFSTSVDPQANGGQLSMIDTSHSSLFGPPVGISGNQVSTGMPVQGSAVHQSAVAASMGGLPSQLPSNSQGTSGIQEATSSHDSKSSGRTALPVDFFTSLYPSATPAMPGWQRAPQSGMGFGMQYPALQGMQSYPQIPTTYVSTACISAKCVSPTCESFKPF